MTFWRSPKQPSSDGTATIPVVTINDITNISELQTWSALKNFTEINKLTSQLADIAIPITKFGASTSSNDNVSAIQQTIDYVASLGGGTVLIPKGTWYVKAINRTIFMKSNVTIKGVHRNSSIIKIHESSGNWGELFTYPTPAYLMRDIAFKDLTMDCNINNVVGDSVMWSTHRMFINGGEGYNYTLDNVKFVSNGIWVIHADINNSTLKNCEVEYNLSTYTGPWFDISAFWIGGKNNEIRNNVFWRSGMTTFTPETAIEFQGHNFHVHDNRCLGFTNGILPTPSTSYDNVVEQLDAGGRGIKVYNNTIEASNKGIFIWSMNLPSGYLEDLRIYNNTIYINDDQQGHSEPNAGIDFKLQSPTSVQSTPMKNISIYNNYIEYKTRTVSDDLYSGDAGIKAYLSVELIGYEIRGNTIVNCGGSGVILHQDVNYNNWIKRVKVLGNIFKDTKTPIYISRNVSDVVIKENIFEQLQLYGTTDDNMTRTVRVANNTYTSNVNYTVLNNEVRCASEVNPYYPIYDLSLIDDGGSYPASRGMKLEKTDTIMLLEPPAELVTVTTVAKNQYIRRNNGLMYKTKFNYPSTIGSLKAADGTTNVTITQWISNNKLQVSDATNIKPNQAIALDFTNYFTGSVFYVKSVTGNVIETTAGNGASLKGGVTAGMVVGSILTYYTDLLQVTYT